METINNQENNKQENNNKTINILSSKIHILKNGDTIIYSYDQKIYNDVYYNKFKNEPMKKIKCNCGGITDKYNNSTHNKSIKHKKYLSSLIINDNENTL